MELLHAGITDAILKAYYHVFNSLGYGFLEKVYENSLKLTLEKAGFCVGQQVPLRVIFEGNEVGEYFADLIVNGLVIIENKASASLAPENEAQLLNYLRATDIEVGLLLNFGTKPEFRRKVFANHRKSHSGS